MSENCKENNLERSHHKKKTSVTVYGGWHSWALTRHCGNHFTIHMNIKSLRDTPETNIMYVNYTSMKARKETGKKEIIFIFFGNQLLHQEGSFATRL